MKKWWNSKSGFTLVELVMVVIIIGILAAIIIPKFAGHTLDAQVAATKANLSNLRSAIELYRIDHGSYPPNLGTTVWNGKSADGTKTYLRSIPYTEIEDTASGVSRSQTISTTATGAGGWRWNSMTEEITADITDGVGGVTWSTT